MVKKAIFIIQLLASSCVQMKHYLIETEGTNCDGACEKEGYDYQHDEDVPMDNNDFDKLKDIIKELLTKLKALNGDKALKKDLFKVIKKMVDWGKKMEKLMKESGKCEVENKAGGTKANDTYSRPEIEIPGDSENADYAEQGETVENKEIKKTKDKNKNKKKETKVTKTMDKNKNKNKETKGTKDKNTYIGPELEIPVDDENADYAEQEEAVENNTEGTSDNDTYTGPELEVPEGYANTSPVPDLEIPVDDKSADYAEQGEVVENKDNAEGTTDKDDHPGQQLEAEEKRKARRRMERKMKMK